METDLAGKKVLFITSNVGIEERELLKPMDYLKNLKATITHGAIRQGEVQTFLHDLDKGAVVSATCALLSLKALEYDALVIPGGTVNSDKLRIDPQALRLVNEFSEGGKIIAAVCHAPWLLIEAGLVSNREVTSYISIKTDLLNAGAKWLDKPVVISKKNNTIITSRNPDDLSAFSKAIEEELLGSNKKDFSFS